MRATTGRSVATSTSIRCGRAWSRVPSSGSGRVIRATGNRNGASPGWRTTRSCGPGAVIAVGLTRDRNTSVSSRPVLKPPTSPFREAFGGWVLGSTRFVEELRTRAGLVLADPAAPEARRLAALDPEVICNAVVDYYGLDPSALLCRHDPHLARAVAAWLCRRRTEAPLRELAVRLGLSGATSVPNLTRRLEARLEHSPRLARELTAIMRQVKAQAAPPATRSRPSRLDHQKCESGPTKAGTKTTRRKNKKKV